MSNFKFFKAEFAKVLLTTTINKFWFFFTKRKNGGNCKYCGNNNNYFVNLKLRPDFDTTILPDYIGIKFKIRKFGFCLNCGLSQSFNNLTKQELLDYISIISDKDLTVSEEVFHSWPIPNDFVEKQNINIFKKRSTKLIEALKEFNYTPKETLFLRPIFGYLYNVVNENFPINAFALEISSRAKRFCNEKYPNMQFLDGNLHGYFSQKNYKKFDSIFCFHSLIHSIDFIQDLVYLKSILQDDGFIVFSQEVISKPYNPFHTVYTTDNILERILKEHFNNVNIITDCEEIGVNISCEKVTDSKTVCDFIVSSPK
jgi:hypothetical protein